MDEYAGTLNTAIALRNASISLAQAVADKREDAIEECLGLISRHLGHIQILRRQGRTAVPAAQIREQKS